MLLKKKKKEEENVSSSLPPGPRNLPLIGNLHQLGDLPHQSLHRLSHEYGPLMFLKLGSVPTLVVSSADMVREIFRKHDRVFSDRPILYAGRSSLTIAPTWLLPPMASTGEKFYDKVIEENLDPMRHKPMHEDLVDILLRVQKDPSQAISFSNEQIKGVLTDMFIAGTDTSSATLVWTMAELIRNPSAMNKAQNEVRKVVKGKGNVEESDLTRFVYLKSLVKESLRLHPPAPLLVPRETIESCKVLGYDVPAQTRVFISAMSIGRDPKSWENPNEFQPERFFNSGDIEFKGQNFEFLPFRIGRRGCPGTSLALLLVELALANLLYWFDWRLPEGMRAEDMNMEEAFALAFLCFGNSTKSTSKIKEMGWVDKLVCAKCELPHGRDMMDLGLRGFKVDME
ncbi:hypothetical protein RJ639_016305 [Escallonia herrerae]|uniref:Cytochrome P450 n=1 Tax=Escallonia herrerae TaxID=1293975 RepID=A0AA89ALG7_9ASTE|nr:hypothetical protein RJ639_016305 [Escallonia herrerae]